MTRKLRLFLAVALMLVILLLVVMVNWVFAVLTLLWGPEAVGWVFGVIFVTLATVYFYGLLGEPAE